MSAHDSLPIVNLLPIEHMGMTVQGVHLYGDPKKRPEPETFRVVLPFGDVDIVRVNGEHGPEYWVHVRAVKSSSEREDNKLGRFTDARVDYLDRNASDTVELAGALLDPAAYHAAIRLGVRQ